MFRYHFKIAPYYKIDITGPTLDIARARDMAIEAARHAVFAPNPTLVSINGEHVESLAARALS